MVWRSIIHEEGTVFYIVWVATFVVCWKLVAILLLLIGKERVGKLLRLLWAAIIAGGVCPEEVILDPDAVAVIWVEAIDVAALFLGRLGDADGRG